MKKIVFIVLVVVICFSVMGVYVYANTYIPTSEAYTLVNYLENQVGKYWDWNLCQAFIWDSMSSCLGINASKCCAYQAWKSYGISTDRNNIPVGATVYFSGGNVQCKCGNMAGHVAFYVGNGMVIHAYNGSVHKDSFSSVCNWSKFTYLGWGWHANHPLATVNTPLINTITARSDGVYLSWSAVSNAVKYNVFRSTTENIDWNDYIGDTTSTSYLDTSELNVGTTYYYKVAARFTSSSSDFSSAQSIVYPRLPVPAIQSIKSSAAGVQLTWATAKNADGYYVFRSTSGVGNWDNYIGSTKNGFFLDASKTGLEPGQTYYYQVAAYDYIETTGFSESASVKLPNLPAPTQLKATAVSTGIEFSWNAVSNISGYYVFRSTSNQVEQISHENNCISRVNTNRYIDTDVQPNKTYYYFVAAYTDYAASPISSYCQINAQHICKYSLTSHSAKSATCTAAGNSAYWSCSCGKYFADAACTKEITKDSWIVKALGHNLVHHGAQTATCTASGWNAYDTCSRCNYTTKQVVSALGHYKITHDAKAATCTEAGWNAYDTCSRCDYTTYVEIPKLSHTPGASIVIGGKTVTYCSVCGEVTDESMETLTAIKEFAEKDGKITIVPKDEAETASVFLAAYNEKHQMVGVYKATIKDGKYEIQTKQNVQDYTWKVFFVDGKNCPKYMAHLLKFA